MEELEFWNDFFCKILQFLFQNFEKTTQTVFRTKTSKIIRPWVLRWYKDFYILLYIEVLGWYHRRSKISADYREVFSPAESMTSPDFTEYRRAKADTRVMVLKWAKHICLAFQTVNSVNWWCVRVSNFIRLLSRLGWKCVRLCGGKQFLMKGKDIKHQTVDQALKRNEFILTTLQAT